MSWNRRSKIIVSVVVATIVLAGAVVAAASTGGARRQLAEVRAATSQYRDPAAAEADGYVLVSECVDGRPEFNGAMGYHYLKFELLEDPAVDITEPELLVYYPTKHGELRLGAVEWMKIDDDQDLETDDDRPVLFGEPFKGPMPGHDAEMPVHYDLHAWLYRSNPSGLFADWNPRVTCPVE